MNVKQEIARLKQQIRLRELSNDSYYLSPQSREDSRAMYELQKLLKQKRY